MDLANLGDNLVFIGCFSSGTFMLSGVICDGMYRDKEAIASSVLMSIGSGMAIAGLPIHKIGVDNNIQEITGYVSSLSDEELESLSEDLVEIDISDTDIEEGLADRMDLLSENSDVFNNFNWAELQKMAEEEGKDDDDKPKEYRIK